MGVVGLIGIVVLIKEKILWYYGYYRYRYYGYYRYY